MYHQLSGLVVRSNSRQVRPHSHRITHSHVNTRSASRVVPVNRMRKSAISIHKRERSGEVDLIQTRALAQGISVAHIRVLSRSTNLDISRFLQITRSFPILRILVSFRLGCQMVPPKIRELCARNRNNSRDILYFTIGLMENVKSAKWSSRLH